MKTQKKFQVSSDSQTVILEVEPIRAFISVISLSFFSHSSRAHPPMFAVGSDDSNVAYGGKVQIYEYNENTRWAPESDFYASE